MTAVDMAKLNRPGVMSSYSSSGRKNTVHGSKSTVVGSTFNQARMTGQKILLLDIYQEVKLL